jgi:FkbM family methyltransferase
MAHASATTRPRLVAPLLKRAALHVPAIRRLYDDRERLARELIDAWTTVDNLRNKRGPGPDRVQALPPARTARLKNVDGLDQLKIELLLHPEPDVISDCIFRFGHWEQTETKFVLKQIKPGHRVLDLGANLGYYTALFSRLAGESGRVLAIEPEDDNFRLLALNVAHNRLGNVSLMKALVGSSPGMAKLQHHTDNRGAHMVFPTGAPGFAGTSLHPRISLDSLLHVDIEHVDFIKMDTQGSEPLIVAGGRDLIARNAKHLTMIIEFSPVWIQQCCGRDPLSFYDELLAFGFEGYFIHPLRNEVLPVDDPVELIKTVEACDGIAWPKAVSFVDLILRPR